MAEALGVSLGQLLAVSEAGNFMPVQADAVRSLKVAAGTPLEAGALTVSVDVNMVFGI
jgi:uncharacterized protein YggE